TQAPDSRPPDEMMLFDFSNSTAAGGWRVEDDVVMGGVSRGRFFINDAGNGVFSGNVSLENNGGFSSVQHDFDPIDVSAYSTAMIRLKGDGKRYQFRVESDRRERHAYVYTFQTTGEWQTVEIPLREMTPQFRGRRLNLPNYPGRTMVQARFLIANGVAESFRLEIDNIRLK
ncbi:MAG TPA: CIA30 family protein, partial [Tichowtungia sp.]|nr:CIA30 family protein [Tichowtungia sp.]